MQQTGAQQDLSVGARVEVWWPRHNRSFGAKICKISDAGVQLYYDNGAAKTYTPSEIIPRMAFKEVCNALTIPSAFVMRVFFLCNILHKLYIIFLRF